MLGKPCVTLKWKIEEYFFKMRFTQKRNNREMMLPEISHVVQLLKLNHSIES